MRKKWTIEENNFLKHNYKTKGAKYCAETLGRTRSAIQKNAQTLKIKGNLRLNKEDLSHIFRLDDPFIIYFLGFLWADGHICKKGNCVKISIVEEDFKNIQDQIHKLGKSWTIKSAPQKKGRSQILLSISHAELKKFLVENDYRLKSLISADQILSKIPKNLQHYWFRGFFDGDGCFCLNKKGRVFFSMTGAFDQKWDFVENLLMNLNIKYSYFQKSHKSGNGSVIVCYNQQGIITFGNYLYQGEQFGLLRKYEKFSIIKSLPIKQYKIS